MIYIIKVAFGGIYAVQGYSSVGRTSVSKTGCRGFKSFCPCSFCITVQHIKNETLSETYFRKASCFLCGQDPKALGIGDSEQLCCELVTYSEQFRVNYLQFFLCIPLIFYTTSCDKRLDAKTCSWFNQTDLRRCSS